MMRWLLLGIAASGSACMGSLVGLFVTFPSQAASEWAAYQVHERDDDYALEVGDVRPWVFPGLRATDVTFYSVKKGRKTKDDPEPAAVRSELLKLDSLAVRIQVLPRILGTWSFGYAAEMMDGTISGHYARGDSGAELSFEIADLDLGLAPIQTDDATVILGGKLGGSSDLVLDSEDVKASTGSLELVFDGLKLAEGSKVMGLVLPVVQFATAKVRLEAKEGKLAVTEGTFDGDVIDMTLSGDIAINKKIERSRNRMELVVTLPPDLDQLARIAPSLKRARDAEGAYHFNIGGTIVSPTFRAGRGTGGIAKNDDDGPRGRLDGGDEGSEMADGDAGTDADATRDERKRKREERIKERRERLRKRREEAGTATSGAMDEGPEFDPRGREPRDVPPDMGPDEMDGPPPFDREDEREDFGEGPPPDGMPDWGPPDNDNPPGFEE